MKELIEQLKAVNDGIATSNEIAEKERAAMMQQLNGILFNLLLALLAKQK